MPSGRVQHARREQREADRIRRAAAEAERAGHSATQISLAQIRAAFDEAAVVNAFKMRVERMITLGPRHPALRARFSARAALLRGASIETAVVRVEQWWRDERKAFQIASALGCATRLSLDVLGELRLLLRLMRSKRMRADFHAILADIDDEPSAIAAE